jgi:hypothetical protein
MLFAFEDFFMTVQDIHRHYIVPPIAAGCAIVPTYYFFARKSMYQLNLPRQQVLLRDALKVSPMISVSVGSQIILQNMLNEHTKHPVWLNSIIAAMLTSPFLAIFNGYTGGKTVYNSLKGLTLKQINYITFRESCFLFSMQASFMISDSTSRFAQFAAGFLGSILSHPADTLLTWSQTGLNLDARKHIMRGGLNRGIGTGLFVLFYNEIKDTIR